MPNDWITNVCLCVQQHDCQVWCKQCVCNTMCVYVCCGEHCELFQVFDVCFARETDHTKHITWLCVITSCKLECIMYVVVCVLLRVVCVVGMCCLRAQFNTQTHHATRWLYEHTTRATMSLINVIHPTSQLKCIECNTTLIIKQHCMWHIKVQHAQRSQTCNVCVLMCHNVVDDYCAFIMYECVVVVTMCQMLANCFPRWCPNPTFLWCCEIASTWLICAHNNEDITNMCDAPGSNYTHVTT